MNHEIMTWAKTKSQMLNRLSHPGAPVICLSYFPLFCIFPSFILFSLTRMSLLKPFREQNSDCVHLHNFVSIDFCCYFPFFLSFSQILSLIFTPLIIFTFWVAYLAPLLSVLFILWYGQSYKLLSRTIAGSHVISYVALSSVVIFKLSLLLSWFPFF